MEFIKKVIKYVKEVTVKEMAGKALIISMLAIAGAIAVHIFAVKVLPWILLALLLGVPYIAEKSQNQRRQQKVDEQKFQQDCINLYQRVASLLLPILVEYKVPLGIAPTTVNSLFADNKFVQIPGVDGPACIFTVERKSSTTIPMTDLKRALQTRFNQENLGLYLINIDERSSNYLTFSILPIVSGATHNWAKEDMKRQFYQARGPQEPGERGDTDF